MPSAPEIVFATYPIVVVASEDETGRPKIHTIAANTAAAIILKNAPAALTIILSKHEIFGKPAESDASVPSIAPISASCGSATYPPSGNRLTAYSQPSRPFHEKRIGPKPIEKRVIFSLIRDDLADAALAALNEKFNTIRGGKGIAVTVPLTGVIGVSVYQFLCNHRRMIREEETE